MEEGKELIQTQSTSVALPDDLDQYTGYEGFDASQFVIPRMSVIQATSRKENVTPGTFVLNTTNESFPELHLTVIKAANGRILFDDDITNSTAFCRSDDGMVPSPSIIEGAYDMKKKEGKDTLTTVKVFLPPSKQCVTRGLVRGRPGLVPVCEMAMWGPNGERPPCDETRNLLCISNIDLMPFWLSMHGMSLKPTMAWISSLAVGRKPLWKYSTKLTLRKVVDHRGTYYVTVFTPPQLLSEDMQAEMADMVRMLAKSDIAETFEAEQAADTEAAKDDVVVEKPAFMAGGAKGKGKE